MPKVYLGGFPKCGTTDLHTSLISHHNFASNPGKEKGFWTKHTTKGKTPSSLSHGGPVRLPTR